MIFSKYQLANNGIYMKLYNINGEFYSNIIGFKYVSLFLKIQGM